MTRDLQLPPTVEFLLSEARGDSPAELSRQIKDRGFLRDLKNQAEYTLKNWRYADAQPPLPGGFVVAPSGGADPLFGTDKCPVISCRIEGAHAFAHSIALYADLALIPDVFTGQLVGRGSSQEHAAAHALFNDIAVVRELMPLLEERVVQFASPPHFCERCDAALLEAARVAVDSITDGAAEDIADIRLTSKNGKPVATVMFEPGFVPLRAVEVDVKPSTARRIAALRSGRKAARNKRVPVRMVRELLGDILHDLTRPLAIATRDAQRSGAVVAARYRAEALFLHRIESRSMEDAKRWERIRTIQLPFVRDLQVRQIVQLREDAQHALPALRHLLNESLRDPTVNSDARIVELVSHLRDEALKVQQELGVWERAKGYQFHAGLGFLGLSYVLYGLATTSQIVGSALSSFISTLRGAHSDQFKQKLEAERLKTRPGYILVRAKELASHRR